MSVVSVEEIAEELGKEFTDGQKAALQRKIDGYRDELERYLHATIERRERTDVVETGSYGNLNLKGPVINVVQVHRIGSATDSTWRMGWPGTYSRDMIFPSGGMGTYEVTYEAGYAEVDSAVWSLVRNAVLREKIVGVQVASGAYSSLNVEGASVGFGPSISKNNETQRGSFSAIDLRGGR